MNIEELAMHVLDTETPIQCKMQFDIKDGDEVREESVRIIIVPESFEKAKEQGRVEEFDLSDVEDL